MAQEDITVFAVGVGNSTDMMTELNLVASPPSLALNVRDFQALSDTWVDVVTDICKGQTLSRVNNALDKFFSRHVVEIAARDVFMKRLNNIFISVRLIKKKGYKKVYLICRNNYCFFSLLRKSLFNQNKCLHALVYGKKKRKLLIRNPALLFRAFAKSH